MFNSTWHWQPIVNGYSGFFPQSFMELAEETDGFPDDRSIAYLKNARRGFHRDSRQPDGAGEFGEMTAALLARPDIEATAQFEEPDGVRTWCFGCGE